MLTPLATAAIELKVLLRLFNNHPEWGDDQAGHTLKAVFDYVARINTTPPQTFGDCLTKLRLLADPDIGMEAGDREDDLVSLRQVLVFLEGTEHDEEERGFGPQPP